MPDIQTQIINLVDSAQAAQLRQENALIQEIARAYENARRDLLARFSDQFAALGDDPTPEQIRQLANDANLIRAIEERLAQLEHEMNGIIRSGLTDVSDAAFDLASKEIVLVAEALGVNLLPFALDAFMELTIGPAIEQVPGLISTLRAQLLGTLREMLASGDRFSDIVRIVYQRELGIFPRGRISAELMIRRAVIQAGNNSKMLYYAQAQKQIPGLQKQVVASVGGDTTDTCLRAHGQIQPLDKPFNIEGTPSYGRRQMQPPFHWNCRSSVAPYHPIFERTSSLTTPAMQAAAQAELANR
ncbi:MAG: hypothetical protein IPM39_29475 [Chloroflexi bacterium]|nr:hypothetical protein [Chloroflexota bacterium]